MANKHQVEALLDKGLTARQIAERIGAHPSWVNATLHRNGWRDRVSYAFQGASPEQRLKRRLVEKAAPDLLEALKALRDAVKAVPSMQGREYVGLGIQVNDAIAKAEGRA